MKTPVLSLLTLLLVFAMPAFPAAATSPAPLARVSGPTDTFWTEEVNDQQGHLQQEAGRDLSQLVAEGVSFFVTVIACYFAVGTAAGFVESQWGVTVGSTQKPFGQAVAKIGQLAFAFILAAMAYPLVSWLIDVILPNI